MITLCVDQNNDLCVKKSNLETITGLKAVIQSCEQAAKTQLGEVFLDTTRGVPNTETIWTSRANIAQFQSYLQRMILSVPDVIGVKSLETDIVENNVVYSIEIETIYGTEIITNVV